MATRGTNDINKGTLESLIPLTDLPLTKDAKKVLINETQIYLKQLIRNIIIESNADLSYPLIFDTGAPLEPPFYSAFPVPIFPIVQNNILESNQYTVSFRPLLPLKTPSVLSAQLHSNV
ncbi:hypothetical protein BLNAU_2144 [Blattamonas nauphoetae]|uniref:Uncharacterized protein n=1 Tax=Blattamonas nauphoetae TaxID=2049346 RepID=A0ABQ9YG23_9EUKA|nr:hypothetical protein BLNAU_2144 [Blattamonas nauphoetae]